MKGAVVLMVLTALGAGCATVGAPTTMEQVNADYGPAPREVPEQALRWSQAHPSAEAAAVQMPPYRAYWGHASGLLRGRAVVYGWAVDAGPYHLLFVNGEMIDARRADAPGFFGHTSFGAETTGP